MLELDHFAIAASSLEEGAAWLRDRLGVELQPGGKHPALGTHNMLLSLGPREYIELIAIDPDAPRTDSPGWFGLRDFTGPPRIAGWVLRQSPLEAPEGTHIAEVSRADLRWRITLPDTGQMPGEGTTPMRIDWGNGPHPSDRLPDHGLRLTRLTISAPVAQSLPLDDPRISLTTGPAGFKVRITTPTGEVLL
ncbi:VOC family protein [Paracoccus alkanivorans]|uniref:VOC family protein n=1 Tax=Paracoccus alkanivorans TaxID=2116655 RepID=A0A3M0MPI5_9RHOB|nr:VOC family protein [Paracoccus alkanivorans]RMC37630.1 VOC family protein [Paracoccus alkanivorans]